jgi:hypothetical protein
MVASGASGDGADLHQRAVAKLDWPSLPQFGLIEGHNEARDQDGMLVYTFVNRVLIARRPV